MDVDAVVMHRDRGASAVEYAIMISLVAIVIVVGLVFFGSRVFGLFADSEDAVSQAMEPETVKAPMAGTIDDEPDEEETSDACASLPGRQPSGFDCSLPLNVNAIFLGNGKGKVRYACPDNYTLIRGQKLEQQKICILTTAR